MRVAVIEDDDNICALVEASLKQGGHTAHVARDGIEGLEVVLRTQPDAVLLDVNMPRLDGFGVLERMRSWRDAPPPVIMLTAQSAPEDIRKAIQLGATDFLGKPFLPPQLLRRLERVARQNDRLARTA